ncbi:MAG: SDR family NAD(P)-dependent oxidoreductase [Myxococcota bacterium]
MRETAAAIEALGGRALPIVGDLADPGCLDGLVARARDALGPIDVLVNNAAAAFYLPFEKTSEKRFRIAYDLNVFAPWRLAQLVAPRCASANAAGS